MGRGKKRSGGKTRGNANDSSDDEKQAQHAHKKPRVNTNTAPVLTVPDWSKMKPFKKNFWTGDIVENPTEDLKLERKSIGVVVKGNVAGCPPPTHTAQDARLPAIMGKYFEFHGLQHPTSIQKQSWPAILAGSNVLAVAPTGSGKTLAYCLPMAHKCLAWAANSSSKGARPSCLVLLPTRELALQVVTVIKGIRRSYQSQDQSAINFNCAVLYGGQSKQDQVDKMLSLGNQLHVLIATPGRLLDVLQSDSPALLCETKAVVVDEADRMLGLGFREQLDSIFSVICPQRQAVLFTATFPSRLREACDLWAPEAVVLRCAAIQIEDTLQQRMAASSKTEPETAAEGKESEGEEEEGDPSGGAAEEIAASDGEGEGMSGVKDSEQSGTSSVALSPLIKQHIHICAAHKRPRLLLKYLDRIQNADRMAQKRQRSGVVIFANAIKTIKFVQDLLQRHGQSSHASSNYGNENGHKAKGAGAGYRLAVLHGQMPQPRREEELMKFRSGKADILIASDVAARGLDIKRVNYVVNYDFPPSIEQYCHRIGRTGRDQSQPAGEAYSLFTRNFLPLAKELIHLLQVCKQPVEKNLLALVQSNEGADSEEGEEEEREDADEEEKEDVEEEQSSNEDEEDGEE